MDDDKWGKMDRASKDARDQFGASSKQQENLEELHHSAVLSRYHGSLANRMAPFGHCAAEQGSTITGNGDEISPLG